MKNVLYFLMCLAVISCNDDDDGTLFIPDCTDGAGAIVSETRSLTAFHSIENAAAADIYLTQGPQEDLRIDAQSNILDLLKTEVTNEVLRIEFDGCVKNIEPISIFITIPEIRSLRQTGVGNITAENDLDLQELEVLLTGVGDINLKGMADLLNLQLTGVGSFRGFDLVTEICDVVITGVGDVEVYVNKELDVTITGNGTVYYKGIPVINSTITGSGSVEDANK